MIWVDADSCPIQVRGLIIRFALRLAVPVCFVANRAIPLLSHPLITMHLADNEPDAADDYIVDSAAANDIAITRDIPLAHRLVKKKLCVINDRGIMYDENNINDRLAARNLNLELYERGLTGERTGVYGKKELNAFANCLDRCLQRIQSKS